jgi:hypothetical protein
MNIKRFSILLIISMVLAACTNGVESKEHLGEIYIIALDSMMEIDTALNSEIEFVAIDMSNFKDLNNQDKEEILSYFREKYKVNAMDATMEELQEKGLYNQETMSLKGVLLSIGKVNFKLNDNVFFEGSKYHSSLGAVGVEITVYYKAGKWQIKKLKQTWVS